MESTLSQFSADEIAGYAGGVLAVGNGDVSFSGVSIDSRTLRNGDLFFAIRGPNQDGHKFIPNAVSSGARGIVAESGHLQTEGFPSQCVLIKVGDTHQALKDLASAVRRRWQGTAVGITGSMGKTTVKEFAAQMLQGDRSVYRTPGNYNNLYGLPLAIFGLTPNDSIGIFEMGMSAPGEIAEMCRIAKPTIGIITNVAPVHLEFFNSLEEIARAKGELAEALPAAGTLIYNGDIPLVRDIAAQFGGHKISFGFTNGSDFHADRIEIVSPEETRFRLSYSGKSTVATIPLPGAHFVENALPAVALASHYGLATEQITENLRHMRQVSMRGRILHFREGFSVIDDSYNSNPEALKSMIEVLCQLPLYERRILVAGEMLELGPDSAELHRECGRFASKSGVTGIVGVQGASQEIVRAAQNEGMTDKQARFFQNAEEASAFLQKDIRKGDLVLVKGSRGVRMETIVKSFRSNFECPETQ
ncbi:MAG: UDP-N-acetylmuramoyl-tripeptide--D-alanyl-D-alanine ligase [Acidobacteria bacterium]|nr:UDP-N-acetylmuramoyl-tripeptide--D-alanyl-D-alanine ligase [Acidobacteriota bacterium]